MVAKNLSFTANDHMTRRGSRTGSVGLEPAFDGILGEVQMDSASSQSLDARLVAAQVEPSTEPHTAWRRLREAEGRRTTVTDLYELVARRRGLVGHQLPQAERVELARSVMPIIWPGFARTEGSDRQDLYLEVVAYDPSRPRRYERWRDRLDGQLAHCAAN
jgi:hypothetical protein